MGAVFLFVLFSWDIEVGLLEHVVANGGGLLCSVLDKTRVLLESEVLGSFCNGLS